MNNSFPSTREHEWGHDYSVAGRCLALLERHAAKYVTGASFGLSREIDRYTAHHMTDADRARCRQLLRDHYPQKSQYWIAQRIGFSQACVCKIWKQMRAEAKQ
jgi:hypothetical protein